MKASLFMAVSSLVMALATVVHAFKTGELSTGLTVGYCLLLSSQGICQSIEQLGNKE